MSNVKALRPALDCYRVVVCTLATCDVKTGLATYTLVHESWTLPAASFGTNIPLLCCFELQGKGMFEVRMAWYDEEGDRQQLAGDAVDTVAVDGRQKFMSAQVRVPDRAGTFDLVLEWRLASAASSERDDRPWRRTSARAPIVVREAEAAQPVVH